MKLRITIEGKTYEADVEILESEESGPDYQSYAPVSPAFVPATLSGGDGLSRRTAEVLENEKECRSPVTGMVISVNVKPGQSVQAGDVLVVLESMKMEMQITAQRPAIVKKVLVAESSTVRVNQVLVEFEE